MQPQLADRFTKLEQTREDLFREISQLDNSILNWQPKPGAWSILQVLQHLSSSETLALRYVRKKMQDPNRANKAGWKGRARVRVLQSAFNVPLKYKAPDVLETFPETSEPAEIFKAYADLRAEWRGQLELVSPEIINKELFKHQLVGRMSLPQAIDFFQSHFEHHMKQISRIRKAYAAKQPA